MALNLLYNSKMVKYFNVFQSSSGMGIWNCCTVFALIFLVPHIWPCSFVFVFWCFVSFPFFFFFFFSNCNPCTYSMHISLGAASHLFAPRSVNSQPASVGDPGGQRSAPGSRAGARSPLYTLPCVRPELHGSVDQAAFLPRHLPSCLGQTDGRGCTRACTQPRALLKRVRIQFWISHILPAHTPPPEMLGLKQQCKIQKEKPAFLRLNKSVPSTVFLCCCG